MNKYFIVLCALVIESRPFKPQNISLRKIIPFIGNIHSSFGIEGQSLPVD